MDQMRSLLPHPNADGTFEFGVEPDLAGAHLMLVSFVD